MGVHFFITYMWVMWCDFMVFRSCGRIYIDFEWIGMGLANRLNHV